MAGRGPRLLADALKELRAERDNMSRSKLSRLTVRTGYEGVPEGTIKALENNPGRIPSAETLEALATALGIEPTDFYEYPVALARRATSADAEAAVERETRAAAQPRSRRSANTEPGERDQRRQGQAP